MHQKDSRNVPGTDFLKKKKKKKHELLVILLAGASNNRFFFLFYEFFFFDHLGKRCSPLVNVENMETDIKK